MTSSESLPETIQRLDRTIQELAGSIQELSRELTGSVRQLSQVLQLQRDAARAELASLASRMEVSHLQQQGLAKEIAALRAFVAEKFEEVLRGQGQGPDAGRAAGSG